MGIYQPAKRSATPSTVGWVTDNKGRLWYAADSNTWEYWNGSNIRTMSSSLDTASEQAATWWGPVYNVLVWATVNLFFDQNYVNLFANSDAQAIRVMLNKEFWEADANTTYGSYQDHVSDIVSWCNSAGMKCICDLTSWDEYSENHQQKATIMANSGSISAWIDWGENVVTVAQPDAVGLLNEPWEKNDSSEVIVSIEDYVDFCSLSIAAYRSIDPDITVVIQPLPFYKFEDSTWQDFVGAQDNALAEWHLYYSLIKEEVYSSGWTSHNKACWNYEMGSLSSAQSYLWSYIEGKFGSFNKNNIIIGECSPYRYGANTEIRTVLDGSPSTTVIGNWDDPRTINNIVYGSGTQGTPNLPNWKSYMSDWCVYADTANLGGVLPFSVSWGYALTSTSGATVFSAHGQHFMDYVDDTLTP